MKRALACVLVGGCSKFLGIDDLAFDRPEGMIEYKDDRAGPLFIDPFEVKNTDYAAWLATDPENATNASCAWNTSFLPGDWESNGSAYVPPGCMSPDFVWDNDKADFPNRPVRCIDWCDAAAYCQSQRKKLCGGIAGRPTTIHYDNVAQAFVYDDISSSAWYLACSRGGELAYPYGGTYDADACNATTGVLADVGSRPRCEGGYPGIFDMNGNIEEWGDACVDSSPDSACAQIGGAFYTAQLHDSSWLRCDFLLTISRRAMSASLGVRCCWEP
jgi:formylglycine-generating enzyme required for sulfatase activity